MAKMIPSQIEFYDPKSREDELYKSLKQLPNDYYVFHSLRTLDINTELSALDESEADFLVFHPDYGCLVIEAKGGKVTRDTEGMWHYQNGEAMKDPFNQAATSSYKIFNGLLKRYSYLENYIKNCKFLYAVWFHSYSKEQVDKASFGPNIVKELIIPQEAINNPRPYIEAILHRIQKIHVVYKPEIITSGSGYEHNLTKEQAMVLFKQALCPSYGVVSPNQIRDIEDQVYVSLLKEQIIVLEFLAEQKSAAISGAGGTGKTLIAVERARRLATQGKKVLFLCFNINLKNHLERSNREERIAFFTIDGFTCTLIKKPAPDYYELRKVLEYQISENLFEYDHIIVDEGQDFGGDDLENAGVLDVLADYGTKGEGKSFFIFYDKNQLVQSKRIPSYIETVDSKLTLYRNCRNTKKIAKTSLSLIGAEPILFERAPSGEEVKFVFYQNKEEAITRLKTIINKHSGDGQSDRAILTCKTIELSLFANDIINRSLYQSGGLKTKFYTCRTFKGLEADTIILVDVDEKCFVDDNFLFYVGASRAKKNLYVLINIEEENITRILEEKFPNSFVYKDKKKQLAFAMGGIVL